MPRARRNRNEDPPAEGAPEWMLTYSDLVTLLLTFFIMLFSISVVDKQKYEEVANSLRSAFTRMGSGNMLGANTGSTPVKIYNEQSSSSENSVYDEQSPVEAESTESVNMPDEELQLQNVSAELDKAIKELNIQDYVYLTEQGDTLVLRFQSFILFDLGSAEINSEGTYVLGKLGVILKRLDNEIVIQGHTDNLPINTEMYPTNWELSTRRATNVVLFLVNQCKLNPVKLTASGNGEFRPIAPNDTEANRLKNRRIDIVIRK